MRAREFSRGSDPQHTVPVGQLQPWNPNTQARDLPNQQDLASLTQTLRQGGGISPLLVTPVPGGYRIIDGHHRYFALQQAGQQQAPVRVLDPQQIRHSSEARAALKTTLQRYDNLGTQDVAESLDQPYRIKWERSPFGDLDAIATLEDGSNLLIMFNNEADQWTVEFYRDDRQDITGEGDAQRIFATVLKAIREFIRRKKPLSIVFGAVKEIDPRGSRTRLYDRMVQRYANDLGYTLQRQQDSLHTVYRLNRDAQTVAEGIDPDTFEDLDARIIARAAKQIVPTARARRTPDGYVHVTTEDGLDLYIGAGVADGVISVNIGSGGGVTTSGAHKGAVTDIIRGVYLAAVRKYGEPDTPGELTIDHDAGHGVWQHIADKLGLRYAAVEVKESGMAEGRISDLDIDLQDQQWDSVVGFVQHGVRRGQDPDRMSLDLYRWAAGEMFDVDEELERRGFGSVADLADHIREHGGRYVPPQFDLSAGGSLADIERRPRQRPDDVSENFADGRKPGRKGLSKRVGIPRKATLGQLEKIARSSTGERRRMAQWQLNMRRGRKK